jgi:hypothetical protein
MSSSKSVAAARNRRTEAPPPQFKNVKPTGPITSINTAGGPGTSNTSTYARAQPQYQQQQQQPQYQQQQQQQQQYQQQQQDQAIPSKVTIANAIGLLTVRIARLEQFVHRYNLEQSGSQPKQGSKGNATDNVEARLDESILRNIVSRLDNLEKDKKTSANVPVPVPVPVKTPVIMPPVAEDPSVIKLNNDLAQLKQEVKDTEALLLKLQSFTMETNQKLVNMLFQDTNEISMTQLTDADCNYEYDPTCNNDYDEQDDEDDHEYDEDTSLIEVLDDIQVVDMQTASGNLKDLIKEELARMPL